MNGHEYPKNTHQNKSEIMSSKRGTGLLILSAILLLLAFGGCNKQQGNTANNQNESIDQKVDRLMSKMNLAEKIGQMTNVDHSFLKDPKDITKYYIGSLQSSGDSRLDPTMPKDWAHMLDSLQAYALATPLKIPLIYGIDAVHGNSNIYGATIFPHNVGLGCNARHGIGSQNWPGYGGGSSRHRNQLGVCSLHHGSPGYTMGTNLRRVR